MADFPWGVVPYHDPYDHEVPDVLSFMNDYTDPSLENIPALFDQVLVPSSPHPAIPLFNNGIQDLNNPIPIISAPMRDLGNNTLSYNGGGGGNTPISLVDHPSLFFGEGGESSFDQNQNQNYPGGFGNNVMPLLPIWPPPAPIPYSCCGCQVLREIVHFNSKSLDQLVPFIRFKCRLILVSYIK